MIADKDANVIFFSEILKTDSRFSESCKQISTILNSFGVEPKFLSCTKDIWARDFMPVQVSETKFIEYRYDPDYLQGKGKDRREKKTYPDIVCDTLNIKTFKTDIILDGGNVVKSSNAIILSDKIVEENKRTYNRVELLRKLHELFEVEKVILIPWDRECEYGHSDGMLRFIDDDTVLISGLYDTDVDDFKRQLLNPLEKSNINWKWFKCSNSDEDEDNSVYINFLQTKDLILIPKLNKEKEDEKAFDQIRKYFPDYSFKGRIAQVDMTQIVKFGGALNCISWTIKA